MSAFSQVHKDARNVARELQRRGATFSKLHGRTGIVVALQGKKYTLPSKTSRNLINERQLRKELEKLGMLVTPERRVRASRQTTAVASALKEAVEKRDGEESPASEDVEESADQNWDKKDVAPAKIGVLHVRVTGGANRSRWYRQGAWAADTKVRVRKALEALGGDTVESRAEFVTHCLEQGKAHGLKPPHARKEGDLWDRQLLLRKLDKLMEGKTLTSRALELFGHGIDVLEGLRWGPADQGPAEEKEPSMNDVGVQPFETRDPVPQGSPGKTSDTTNVPPVEQKSPELTGDPEPPGNEDHKRRYLESLLGVLEASGDSPDPDLLDRIERFLD